MNFNSFFLFYRTAENCVYRLVNLTVNPDRCFKKSVVTGEILFYDFRPFHDRTPFFFGLVIPAAATQRLFIPHVHDYNRTLHYPRSCSWACFARVYSSGKINSHERALCPRATGMCHSFCYYHTNFIIRRQRFIHFPENSTVPPIKDYALAHAWNILTPKFHINNAACSWISEAFIHSVYEIFSANTTMLLIHKLLSNVLTFFHIII